MKPWCKHLPKWLRRRLHCCRDRRFIVTVRIRKHHILHFWSPFMSNVVLKVGQTAQAVATATPVDPTVTLPAATYTWSSSSDANATVDANGKVTAVAADPSGLPFSVLITAKTTIDGVDGQGSAGVDVALPGNAFNVTVVITPAP